MTVFDLLKKKIKLISILITREELRSVLDLTVLEPPKDARYKIGDIIHTERVGGASEKFKVYGIKAGGYGFAYIVLDEELTPYCLKTFRERFFDESRRIEQLKREGETWLRLGKHPNIVYAHSILNVGARPHILLEYAAGADLWRQIKQGPIPVREALKYGIQFCRGMAYAQSQLPGFVHGDIKPNNCLLTQDGTLKISDFGQVNFSSEHQEFSKSTPQYKVGMSTEILNTPLSNWRAGTPAYMAPEQFDRANNTDTRSDVYAFGIMLFEMLTGARPFSGKKHQECFVQHRSAIPPDPISLNAQIPEQLACLILSCLAKSPAERPGNFQVLEGELSSLLWNIYGEKILEVSPEEPTDGELIKRAVSWMALDRYDEALACFDNLLSTRPDLARAWSYKGELMSNVGRYDDALECFDRALALDSQFVLAWSNKGKTLDRLGRHHEALAFFDRALALDTQLASIWANKALTLTNLGQPLESLKCLKRAEALDPQHVETHNNRGIAYHKLGQNQQATDSFKRALILNPQHPRAHYNLGNAYSILGRVKEAIESYIKAIGLKPNYPEARRNLASAYRIFCAREFVGEAYAEDMIAFLIDDHKAPEVIVKTSLEFLESSNFDPKVLYLCGNKIYSALENITRQQGETLADGLIKVRKNIATIEPDHDASYWLGKIYYGLNIYDECIEVFQQSILLFGPDDKALYYLAACSEIRGNQEAALAYYKQALLYDPDCSLTLDGIRRMEVELESKARD